MPKALPLLIPTILVSVQIATPAGAQPCAPGLEEGLLQIHPDNSRFLTEGTTDAATGRCRVVLLTGAHTWSIFQDWMDENFNTGVYYDGIEDDGHNFTRGWHWEDFEYTPTPYLEVGSELFDLDRINDEYLDNLGHPVWGKVQRAANRGLYISVMLFQGWSVNDHGSRRFPFENHPYAEDHNFNGIDGDIDDDGEGEETHELTGPEVFAKQRAYVRAVIDALHDYDNLVWEISNESHFQSREWQYAMVEEIKTYEAQMGYKPHLVWTTCTGGNNDFIDDPDNPADLVSPCKFDGYRSDSAADPPATGAGDKIVVADTDHIGVLIPDDTFVWKMVTRGVHPIFMDLTQGLGWYPPGDLWDTGDPEWQEIRGALGAVQTILPEVDLARMAPQGKSTTSPSDRGFSLFSAFDPVGPTPVPDGDQFLAFGLPNPDFTTICDLRAGRLYEANQFDRKTATLNDTRTFFAEADGCETFPTPNLQEPNGKRVVVVKRIHLAPTAAFATDPPAVDGVLEIPAGTTVDFDASASTDPDGGPLEYQWELDGDGLFDDAVGVTAQRTYSDTGSFEVNLRVLDDDGTPAEAEAVTIVVGGEPPTITDHPDSLIALPGDDVTFAVTATGDPPLDYQWRKASVDLTDSGGITGATTDTLLISGVGPDEAGDYDCVVSNDGGSTVSDAAALAVLAGSAVVRDTFSGGTGGSPLDGTVTEVGGLTWSAPTSMAFTAGGEVSAGAGAVGGLWFDPATSGLEATVEADLDPTGSDWLGLGFSTGPFQGLLQNGQLYLKLLPDGTYEVFADGENHLLGSGAVPGYVPGFSRAAIAYDPLRITATVAFNGVEVLSDAAVPFSPAIASVNLQLRAPTGKVTLVDDFDVVQAPHVIRDTFSSGAHGAPLHGSRTEVGGQTWSATASIVFSRAHPYTGSGEITAGAGGVGGLSFDPDERGLATTVEADLDPAGSSWLGLGFSTGPFQGFLQDGQLYLKLLPDGTYEVFADGESHLLGSGAVPGFVVGFNRAAISYDPIKNTASVAFNGVEVLSDAAVPFSPAIASVNLQLRAPTGKVTRADDFEVRLAPASVRDTFTGAVPGAPLDGRSTEVGALIWEADPEIVLSADGAITGDPAAGGVPFDPTLSGLISSLRAEVDLVGDGDGAGTAKPWVGVGFSDGPGRALNDFGQVWVKLRKTGDYRILVGGQAYVLGAGTVPGFHDGFNRVVLSYDPLKNTAWAQLNGVDVLVETELPFAAAISGANVQFGGAAGGATRVDDFEVTTARE